MKPAETTRSGVVLGDRLGERGVPGVAVGEVARRGGRRSGTPAAPPGRARRCPAGPRRRRPPGRRSAGSVAASSRACRLVPAPETSTTSRAGADDATNDSSMRGRVGHGRTLPVGPRALRPGDPASGIAAVRRTRRAAAASRVRCRQPSYATAAPIAPTSSAAAAATAARPARRRPSGRRRASPRRAIASTPSPAPASTPAPSASAAVRPRVAAGRRAASQPMTDPASERDRQRDQPHRAAPAGLRQRAEQRERRDRAERDAGRRDRGAEADRETRARPRTPWPRPPRSAPTARTGSRTEPARGADRQRPGQVGDPAEVRQHRRGQQQGAAADQHASPAAAPRTTGGAGSGRSSPPHPRARRR